MNKIYVFLIKTVAISILLLLGYHFLTKNGIKSDDFFEEVFNVKNINVDVICYNNPREDPDHCVLMRFYRLKNIEKEKLELGIIAKNNSLNGIEIDSFYDYIKCKYIKTEYASYTNGTFAFAPTDEAKAIITKEEFLDNAKLNKN